MRYPLLPAEIKQQMRMIKKVSISAVIGAVFLLIIMEIMGLFADFTTGMIFSSVIIAVLLPLLIPGLLFEKVSQSTVEFNHNSIVIADKKGKCWRTIDYRRINYVQIREVTGFFYGQNKNLYKFPYICIFLNGSTEIPQVGFQKLFLNEGFLMISYNEETFGQFKRVCDKIITFLPNSDK